jgi:hypothetical protein
VAGRTFRLVEKFLAGGGVGAGKRVGVCRHDRESRGENNETDFGYPGFHG